MDDIVPRSISKIASALKRDRATVSAALKDVAPAGRRGGHPIWSVEVARDALTKHDAKIAAARAVNNAAGGGDAGEPTADDADQAAFRRERAQFMRAKREAQEFKNAVAAGKWIRTADAEEAYSRLLSVARVKLLGLGNKTAARVKMCRTIAEVAALINEEVNAILTELSDGRSYGLDADAAE